ncbi:MAG: HAD family phosphatase [Lachnospiraceae bacterium]|nr:HAD family phosphatase [Lachnospiraceae bacterium]
MIRAGIRNIIFDLGGVLVDFQPDRCMEALGFSEEAREIFRKKIFADLWLRCDRIPYNEAEIRALFRQSVPGFEREADRMWDEKLPAITQVMPYTDSWLKSLKQRGFPLFILSNYGRCSYEINAAEYGFLQLTDGQLISYEVQLLKPEKEIYEALCARFAIRPEESVFLDDRPENVEAAERLGFSGIVFSDYESARQKLEKLLQGQ